MTTYLNNLLCSNGSVYPINNHSVFNTDDTTGLHKVYAHTEVKKNYEITVSVDILGITSRYVGLFIGSSEAYYESCFDLSKAIIKNHKQPSGSSCQINSIGNSWYQILLTCSFKKDQKIAYGFGPADQEDLFDYKASGTCFHFANFCLDYVPKTTPYEPMWKSEHWYSKEYLEEKLEGQTDILEIKDEIVLSRFKRILTL